MYRSDSHVHSEFSGDSVESLERIIQRAKDLKMDEITITDHLDLDFPMEPNIFTLDFNKYIDKVKELKNREKDIKVRIGIEIGLQPHLVQNYEMIFKNQDIDFIIGSSHSISRKDVSNKEFFLGKEKYGAGIYDNYKELNYDLHWEIIEKILKKLISKRIGLEVNTSGLRYGLENFHPHTRILKRYKELGGEIITIGSDSHKSEDLMKDFETVKKILKDLGFTHYCTFENKKIKNRDLEI